MSKIIVPLHFAKLTNTPVNVDVGFKKFYLKGEWFKLYNGTSEIDVVLDRPLDNYVPIPGTITSSDTVLTAIEKLDYAISNFSANAAWGSITGTLAAQTDLINYLSSNYVPTTRTLTINGTTYDLSADRSWTISAGVWGSITGTLTAQTDLINYLSTNYYPLSSNPAGYLTQQSVLEFPTFSSFPLIGASNTIYIAVDTDLAYYWDGVSYQIVTTSTSGITGFGTVNTLPKFTPTGSQLGNSRFTDNGLTGRYGSASQYVTFLSGANTFLSLVRSQSNMTFTLGNPQVPTLQENTISSDNTVGTSLITKGYLSFKVGATAATEGLRILSTGQIQLTQTPATGLTSDFLLLRDSTGNLKQIAYPTIPTSTVTNVTATSPITSSGGATPDISTSMSTNKLIGRSTAGTGVMEEITIGTGLTLSGGTLNSNSTGDNIYHGTASGTDTYTVTIAGPTAYNDGDAYLIRFTNGNTTGATLNINGLGAVPLYRNNDGPLLGGDVGNGGEMLCIYNSTLNEFQVIGISPNSLIAYITNDDSVTITKGQAVYAFSGTGDRMTVKLANNVGDTTSAQTIGLVLSTSIGPNQKGFIITQGLLDGINILPTATYSDGDPIYLGSTVGSITNVKPYAPNHLVYLGIVTTASNGSSGRMYVKVQNGYELDELHNVQAQTPTLKDTLWYDNTVSPAQWKTASISTILGYTPQSQLSGTGFVKISGTTISYDNSTYYLASNPSGFTSNTGTVTSVAALTLGTTGTDLSSTVANGTTTPVITLNVPDASATARGVITTGAQTIAGQKTFTSFITAPSYSYTDGVNSGNIFPYFPDGNTYYTIAIAGRTHVFGGGPGSLQNNVQVANGTFNIALQTANTIASFDASKNVVSLPLATYPSLTELSYGKGVTSAIQTQLNGKQNAITLTTTGSSGPATLVGSTLNIPQYSGGGGGSSQVKLASQTLAVGSWTLVGSYYEYTFTNANIVSTGFVNFTPNNASINEVSTCRMLPQIDSNSGTCKFYSLFPPQTNIVGEIVIFIL